MERNVVENEIVEEIVKELNWRERLLVKILKKYFVKTYHIGRIEGVNCVLKKVMQ